MGKKEATLDLFFFFFFHFPYNRSLHCVFLADSIAFQLGCCDRKEQTTIIAFFLWNFGPLQKNCVLSLCRELNFFWVSLSVSPPLDIFIFSHFYGEVSQSPIYFLLRLPLCLLSSLKLRPGLIFSLWSQLSTSQWISSMNGLSFSDLKPQYISLGLQGLGCLILLISFHSKSSFLSLILFFR